MTSRWAGRGALAVLDQALWSGGNFVASLVLARELGDVQFGIFSTAYAILMLFGAVHSALVSEPMLVFGADKPVVERQQYLASVMRYGLLLTVIPSALAAAGGGYIHIVAGNEFGVVLAMFGIGTPFVMMGWVARRACYVGGNYRLAAGTTLVHSIVVVGVVVALLMSGLLSAPMGITPFAVGGLTVAVLVSSHLRFRPSTLAAATFRDVHADHWRFGRWTTGAAALAWVASQSYFVFIPVILSHAANGAVRALGLLILPAMQSFSALGLVLVPRLSRAANGGTFASELRRAIVVFALAGLAYAAVLASCARPIIGFVFGDGYAEYVQIARLYAFLPVIAGVATVVSSGLRAGQWPRDVLLGAVASAAATVILGAWLTSQFGALGAVAGMVVAALVAMLTQAITLGMRIGLEDRQSGRLRTEGGR